jgi:outer membrane protein
MAVSTGMKFLLLLPAAVLLASPAAAQDSDDLRVRVGLGAQVRPEFIGAKDTEVAPLIDVDIARGTNPFRFEAPDDSFALPLISSGGFSAGPAANIESSRKDSDVGRPVGKVPTTFELGAFAQYEMSDSFRARGELLKGIGGHEGVVGAVGGDYIWRDADRYVASIGPRLLFSDARYQRAYFGLEPAAAIASGLPAYRPDGGLHAVALTSGVSYQFNPRWGMFGFARAERLVGDAARSPIVRELGSRNQLSAGLGLSYTFNIRR